MEPRALKPGIAAAVEAHTTLRRAIPSDATEAVAKRFGVTGDQVRRWMREPLSDEAPLSSGQRSPLDRVCDLIDAIYLSNPVGAALVVDYLRGYHQRLLEAATDSEWDRQAHAAHALRETAEAINCLILERTPDYQTIKEITEARDLLDAALLHFMRSRRPSVVGHGNGSPDARESDRPGRGLGRSDSGGGPN